MAFGPNPGIQHADYDVLGIIGGIQEGRYFSQAQELRGVCGVEMRDPVRCDGENGRRVAVKKC